MMELGPNSFCLSLTFPTMKKHCFVIKQSRWFSFKTFTIGLHSPGQITIYENEVKWNKVNYIE